MTDVPPTLLDTFRAEVDFKLVELENILTAGMYNDIGLQVQDKMLLLIEMHPMFSINIVLQILFA